ncbi:hypothetical protein R6Q59_015439 [Mikania micrantha]
MNTNSMLAPVDLSTPVTSGITQGSGEYFAKVRLGTHYYMLIDTGSDINWLQCQPCEECYQQTDPIYNPSAYSSYNALSCGSEQCASLDISACRSNQCLYQVSYGDRSFTVGNFVTETVGAMVEGAGEGFVAAGDGLWWWLPEVVAVGEERDMLN